ncbi:YoaK family protein [Kitasatospora sp. NPDC049258]|uniref:YoaK family protein n=1 Tax=Kitasatospora sp. NPDC049258 TaxID=3155394 RepID=UPI0034236000
MADRIELRITGVLGALTVTSGVVDAVSFLGLGHAFAALATGNLLLLAFGIAGTQGLPVARPAMALAGFVLGAAAAHAVIARRLAAGRRWFVAGLLLESAVVGAGGGYALATGGTAIPVGGHATLVFLLLTFAMGWRSRLVFQTRIPEMPTTLAQMTLIKLVAALAPPHRSEIGGGLTRVQRLTTVVGMFLGGLVGAAALPAGLGVVLLAEAGCVAAVAAVYAREPQLRPPRAAVS